MSLSRVLLGVFALSALTVATGCSGMGGSAPAASMGPTKAIVATTGQGSTVVYVPTSDGSGVQMLSSTGGVEKCPDCEAAALKYFQTGQLERKCPRCGAIRTPVVGHQ